MFKNILMPIDLQETHLAAKAVKIAIDEARKHGADIHVMTVMPRRRVETLPGGEFPQGHPDPPSP